MTADNEKMEFLDRALDVAVAAAKEAGKILVKRQFNGLQVGFKDGNVKNVVTNADTEADAIIRGIILKNFPEHSIISEEDAPKKGNEYTWHVDPLDGTTNYSKGANYYCVSIALAKGSELLLGVIYSPVTSELYTAISGKGAFLNGKKISTGSTNSLEQALVCVDTAYVDAERKKAVEVLQKLLPNVKSIRIKGAGALTLCEVAAGKADAYIRMGSSAWDYAAGTLILREAGGIVTDTGNVPWELNSKTILAAVTEELHGKIIENLQEAAAK